jgi:uncharacterized protein (PEP-CTERM system associated)
MPYGAGALAAFFFSAGTSWADPPPSPYSASPDSFKDNSSGGGLKTFQSSGPGLVLTPSFGVQETFTSNSAGGSPSEDASVTQVNAGFTVHGETAKTKVDLNYQPTFNHYNDGSQDDRVDQNLNGAGSLTPFENILNIDWSALMTEAGASGNTSNQEGILLPQSNRELIYIGTVSPHFQEHFRDVATLDAYYRVISSNISDERPHLPGQPSLSSNSLDRNAEVSLSSGDILDRVGVRLDLNHGNTTGSGINTESTSDEDTVGLNYHFSRRIEATTAIGYQKLLYPGSGGLTGFNSEGLTWSLGVTYTPNRISQISIGYGFRQGSYDPTFQLGIQLAPRTQLAAYYIVDVKNQLQANFQNLRYLRYDQFGNAIDSRTGLPFSATNQTFGQENVLFRDKAGAITLTHQLIRSSFSLGATYESRHTLTGLAGNDLAWGFDGSYSRDFTPLITGNLNLAYTFHTVTGFGALTNRTENLDLGASLIYTISDTASANITERYFGVSSGNPANTSMQQQLSIGLSKSL